jgi:MFS family permease
VTLDPTSQYFDNPKYEMQASIDNFTAAKYGYVAGPFFSLIFGTLILFAGNFSDNYSRRYLLGCAAIFWSATSLGMAFAHTFSMICLCRVLLGVFESFCAPSAYSLISDLFPPEIRTTANSYFVGCISVGAALSSVSTIMIGSLGWRQTYGIVGAYGVCAGFLVLVFIKEPMRGCFDP